MIPPFYVMKKVSAIRKEYLKNITRIKKSTTRLKNEGYVIDNDFIPKIPKRVTKQALAKIQAITHDTIRNSGYLVDESTGEILQGKEAKQHVSDKRKRLKLRTDWGGGHGWQGESPYDRIIITNFYAELFYFREETVTILRDWMEKLIAKHGLHAVAQMLEKGANAGLKITYRVVYDKAKMAGFIGRMMTYLDDTGDLEIEDMLESLELDYDWTEYQ